MTPLIQLFITKLSKLQKNIYDLLDENKRYILSFGAKGYQDYTQHRDFTRKQSYFARHAKNEDWHTSGLYTAGFGSRYLLWNLPSLKDSIKDVNRRFNLDVKLLT